MEHRRGQGKGRCNRKGAGGRPKYCICPNCGYKEPHKVGNPCRTRICPKCNTHLVRE